MQNGRFSGEVDPGIADLFGIETPKEQPADSIAAPEFTDLFQEERADPDEVDLSVKSFARPALTEEAPKPLFAGKDYYKAVLAGEGEVSKRMHEAFSAFLQAQDPLEKSNYRGRVIPIYWDLIASLAPKVTADMPMPKKVFIRFGVLLPTLLSDEQRVMLSKVIWDNSTPEPVFYVDEWIRAVARGQVNVSATDETTPKVRPDDRQRVNSLVDRTKGRYEAQVGLVRTRLAEMDALEGELDTKVKTIREREVKSDFHNLRAPYNDGQRSAINEIVDVLRRLGKANSDVARYFHEAESLRDQLKDLQEKSSEMGETFVDHKIIVEEMNTVRQMTKLAVGRQGNHFPIAMKQYFRPSIQDIATRENIINTLIGIEYLDPGIFLRTFKQQTNRIVPNIIVLPCFGDYGICWEPFERHNRATGRGRLALPLYPKDVRTSIIAACADLRWQVAKEKAQHYWMEEGLTGWYYQWFTGKKMKGDVRETFIEDYILWITKESEATQKLDKEVRALFWRYLPFPQDVKDRLKNRGFVYAELCKKDLNRAMSDGY